MKTEEEIKKQLTSVLVALDDEESQNEITQTKLWTMVDTLKWVLSDK